MIFTAVVAVALAIPSDPYVRSRVYPGTATDHCLYWTEDTNLIWHPEQTGNPETDGGEFIAFEKAHDTWNTLLESCASLKFTEGTKTTSRSIGYDSMDSAQNENILMFRFKSCNGLVAANDGCWTDGGDCGNQYDCWEHAAQAIAITTTTYDPQSGRILDADVEFNTASFIFSTVDSPQCVGSNYSPECVSTDVQNTTTHELGHMMGLDHTLYPGSTMNPTAPPGELSKRIIDPGTASFPCAAYPAGGVSKDCVIIPVNDDLGKPNTGCASTEGLVSVPAVLLAVWLMRRRRD